MSRVLVGGVVLGLVFVVVVVANCSIFGKVPMKSILFTFVKRVGGKVRCLLRVFLMG